MAKNILVTGAAGFIGANLVRRLLKMGARVHVLQKPTSNLWRIKDIKEKLVFHQEQLSDRKGLTSLFAKIRPEVIYHLAAYGNSSLQSDVDEMVKTNILGTLNLLCALKDIPYKCFINTGTSSEYGTKQEPMREEDVCQPISFYAATKLSATILCQVFTEVYKKPVVTLRLFSPYGPYEEPSRFIPTIICSLINKKSIKLTPGSIRRDFIYIDDVINAYLETPKDIDKRKGKIFNIGTGREYTNDEVVETLFRITKMKVPVKKGEFLPRSWDTSHWRADISQTKRLLLWQPKNNLEEGLRKTFNWYQNLYAKK